MEDDATMTESKLTVDNIVELLGSSEYQVVYSSVIQIKNLIIGNNKYKSHFLTDELVRRLIRLLQSEYALANSDSKQQQQQQLPTRHVVSSNESEAVELANQILVVFSSFSLGNLDHVTSLIRVHNVAETVFAALRTTQSRLDVVGSVSLTGMSKQYTRLIESCLLCLSNLYSSSQLMPRLIYMLDKQLYDQSSTVVVNSGSTNLTSLIKYFHLSPRTKQSVLNVISVSSANLMSTSCFMLRKETSVFKRYRAQLIKHELVKLFAGLLTSFNVKLQLNCLKFYASIAFECVEATRQILTAHYYEFSLVDLIAAYLSRENPPELQLYAAKCLTNLYRSGLLIENDFSTDFMMDSDNTTTPASPNSTGLMSLKLISNQLIRAKTMPALVRLVVRFSLNYKNAFIDDYEDPLDPASTQYTSNILYLIESISTLTYLIELNSDLQQIASYLEQILPTLVQNILYSFSNISTFRKKLHQVNLKKLDLLLDHSSDDHATSNNNNSRRNKTINKTTNSSLFSLFYLIYNQFTSKGLHLKLNQHQYNLNSYKLTSMSSSSATAGKSSSSSSPATTTAGGLDCWSRRKCAKFFRMFEINLYKYLISVSLHLMASLASNNEDSRRALTENSDLINKIVETIQLKSRKMSDNSGSGEDEFVNNSDDMKLSQLLENDDCDFDDLLIEFDDESSEQIVHDDHHEDMFVVESSTHSDTNHVHHSITSTDSNLLRLSSLCLLHSLSRSVHQLRTKFLDNKLWNTIVELITRIYNKKLRLNDENALRRRIKPKTTTSVEEENNQLLVQDEPMPAATAAGATTAAAATQKYKSCSKTVSNEEDDEDLLLNEVVEMETETDLLDFSLNEKNLIAILFALVANLVIDFSPCKEMLINNNVIKILVEFIDSKNISIKVNSIWTLMNLAYQADQKVKQQILTEISMEKLFQLLTEQDETLVVKTVGLIRNLISHRPHVDYLMNIYGNKIIQAIIMILEGEYYSSFIKEQALCILANIADGATSKEFIMNNEDLLRKINSFMTHNYTELQVVALYCVSNLVNVNDEGAAERQLKLKEMGAHRILQKLSHSNDPILSEKVKSTLQHFANANASSIYSSSSSSTTSNTSAMI